MKALVEVRDLLVLRGNQPALQLDHLEILEGEVLAVVGPNGARSREKSCSAANQPQLSLIHPIAAVSRW